MRKILFFLFAMFFCFQPAYADFKTVAPQAQKAGWKAKDFKKTFQLGLKGYGKKMPPKALSPKRILRALPENLDYRALGYVTRVKDQGDCGSCWAFSAVGVLEAAYILAAKTPYVDLDLSEQVVVSCDMGNYGCDGWYMDVVSEFLKNSGTAVEECYPYTAKDGKCSNACMERSTHKAVRWEYVVSIDPDVQTLETALVVYGPLITTMMVYSDFMYYAGGVYKHTSGYLEGGHAIILVGYDNPGQYFIAKNSWGVEWGESGFFRIAYSELSNKVKFGEESIFYEARAAIPECSVFISPVSASFGASGGTGSFAISSTTADCPWTAKCDQSWIALPLSGGKGPATFLYSVDSNASAASRTASIDVNGNVFSIQQAGTGGGCDTARPRIPGANAVRPWWKFW